MAVYLLVGSICFVLLAGSRRAVGGSTALLTAAFVAWITVVNLFYLLTQIVIAADDCCGRDGGVARVRLSSQAGARQSGVFLVILGLVALATGRLGPRDGGAVAGRIRAASSG